MPLILFLSEKNWVNSKFPKLASLKSKASFTMAKKTLTKSAVFEYLIITSDEEYFVCQCMIDDDDGERLCETKLSSISGYDKNAPTRA